MSVHNSLRCEWGFHAYRHVSLRSTYKPFIPGAIPSWEHTRRCKRCYLERSFTVFRYPRIRTFPWDATGTRAYAA